MRTILYHVTFKPEGKPARFIAVVHAVEDNGPVRAYHLDDGKHIVPDYAAIRAALPHYHRKAFDRRGPVWFPLTLHSALSGQLDPLNAATVTIYNSKGKVLGEIVATPYLYQRNEE